MVELTARNKADAASADSDDANWGFMRVFVGLVFERHQSMKLRSQSASWQLENQIKSGERLVYKGFFDF